MRRRWLIGGGVAVLVALGVGALAMKRGSAAGAPDDGPDGKAKSVALEFVPTEVVQPLMAAMPLMVDFSGPLVAPRTAVVRAKTSGTLLTLNVAEGSRVKAGQPLGTIDLAELSTRMAERRAMIESQRAQFLQAERTHASNERLADQKFISPVALEASRANLDAARAQLRAAQAQADTVNVNVRDAALVAPISGIVGKRSVVPGEKVTAEQPLLTVVDLATLELVGAVGTHEVSQLKPGLAVEVTVEGAAKPVAGRIDRIAPSAETGTRAISVVVVLDNKNEAFRAGQYAQARVRLSDDTQRLTLPSTAVGQASGQDYVWTVEKDALVRRIVITGRRDEIGGKVEITRGLAAGVQVLAARFDNLKEGAAAKIVAARLAPTASNPASAAPRS
jgi:membrane fusion protein, multidrug efflux system